MSLDLTISGFYEQRPWLQPGKAVLQEKAIYALYITNNTKHFSSKSGCVVQVAKHLKEHWFKELQ